LCFNNIAIGAAYAREQLGIKKIAIIDLDVHHGNGTEEWARNEENYLFASIHQSPLYPGTGVDLNNSKKNIINYALPPGANSYDFRLLVESRLIPSIELFNPNIVLLSIGFDGHELDNIS
jgi:Deacetylases, including yeast histone deacetylase and acetoin utilization protein